MSDWQGQPTIRGFAEDLFERLPKDAVAGPAPEEWGSQDPLRAAHWAQRTAAYHGVVTWSPTIDPERLKLLSQELVLQHDVRLVYHSWASMPIVEDGAVRGMVFESKEGRMAIRARVVVDCTGDGDVFARAGTQFEVRHRGQRRAPLHEHLVAVRRRGHGALDRIPRRPARAVHRVHAPRPRGGGPVRAAFRLLAQRHRAVHGAAPVGLFRTERGRPHRSGSAFAPADGRSTWISSAPTRRASRTPS